MKARRPGDCERLSAALRAEISKLGLEGYTASCVSERATIRLTWPHRTLPDAEESLEIPAQTEWIGRIEYLLRFRAAVRGHDL